MKLVPTFLVALALSMLCANTSFADQTQSSKAEASSSGSSSSSSSQSVTITSDGKRTIKKTVTVRDGVEQVVTEITDEHGNTTVVGDDTGEGDPVPDEGGVWIGCRVREVPDILREQLDLAEDEGVAVDVVAPEGPAAKAGVEVGDLLLSLDGKPISTPKQLSAETRRHKAGDVVEATLMRKGERRNVDITLEERPPGEGGDTPEGLTDGFKPIGDRDRFGISIEGGNVDGLDAVLDDPNVPESFKDSVRKMQEQLREFQQRHGRN